MTIPFGYRSRVGEVRDTFTVRYLHSRVEMNEKGEGTLSVVDHGVERERGGSVSFPTSCGRTDHLSPIRKCTKTDPTQDGDSEG